MPASDEERIRLRDALLRTAQDDLHKVVTECSKRGVAMRDIAALIEGDATVVEEICAGTRSDIADVLRERSPKGKLDHLADLLAKQEPAYLPCVFIVKLASGTIDFSVVALHFNAIN